MKNVVNKLLAIHLQANAYRMMVYYISNKFYCPNVEHVARMLGEMTNKDVWVDFCYEALKKEPDAYMQELEFELQALADDLLTFMTELTQVKFNSQMGEMWFCTIVILKDWAKKPYVFLNKVVDLYVKNHKYFPTQAFYNLLEMLASEGMTNGIIKLAKGCGYDCFNPQDPLDAQVLHAYMNSGDRKKTEDLN